MDAAYKKVAQQVRVPGLPSRQGPGPHHRAALRPGGGAGGDPQRRGSQAVRAGRRRGGDVPGQPAGHRGHEDRGRRADRVHRRGRHPAQLRRPRLRRASRSRVEIGGGRRRRHRLPARLPAPAVRHADRRRAPGRDRRLRRHGPAPPRSTARTSRSSRPARSPTRSAPARCCRASTTRSRACPRSEEKSFRTDARRRRERRRGGRRDHGQRQVGQGEGPARAGRRVRPARQRVRHAGGAQGQHPRGRSAATSSSSRSSRPARRRSTRCWTRSTSRCPTARSRPSSTPASTTSSTRSPRAA